MGQKERIRDYLVENVGQKSDVLDRLLQTVKTADNVQEIRGIIIQASQESEDAQSRWYYLQAATLLYSDVDSLLSDEKLIEAFLFMAENDSSNRNRLDAISWLLTDQVGGIDRKGVQEAIWKIIKKDDDSQFRYSVARFLVPNNKSIEESLSNQFVKEVLQYMAENDPSSFNRQFAKNVLQKTDY